MDGRCGSDADRFTLPRWRGSHIGCRGMSTSDDRSDKNYSLVEQTAENNARLRLDFLGDGLIDDPAQMQLMYDMHFEAMMSEASRLSQSLF